LRLELAPTGRAIYNSHERTSTKNISAPHGRLQIAQDFNLEQFPLPAQQSKLKLSSLPRLLTSDQTFLPYASFHSLRPEPALSDPRFTDQR